MNDISSQTQNILRDKGINFEANSLYYLCEIEGRKFHYSLKTGKWKIKGEQRKWFSSENVEDFIAQAQKYSPFGSKFSERKTNISVHYTSREKVEPIQQNDSVHEQKMSFFDVKSKQLAEAILEVAITTQYPDKLMALAIVQLDNLPDRFKFPSEQVPIYLTNLCDLTLRKLLAEINLSPMVLASIIHQTSELIWKEIVQVDKYNETYQLKELYPPDIIDKIIRLEDVPKVERIIDNELMKRRALAQNIFPCNSSDRLPAKKMATNQIKLLDVVALTVDIPEENLWRGQVGTVVEVLDDGSAFLVEFRDNDGLVYNSLVLSFEELLPLYFGPA